MRITADTNLLIRALTEDHPAQSKAAQAELAAAEAIALPLPVLCELVWVLSRGYRLTSVAIAAVIARLLDTANVALNRPAAEAGLLMMQAGGDFADGVIAYEGKRLAAEVFVSFDRDAVAQLAALGESARLPMHQL